MKIPQIINLFAVPFFLLVMTSALLWMMWEFRRAQKHRDQELEASMHRSEMREIERHQAVMRKINGQQEWLS